MNKKKEDQYRLLYDGKVSEDTHSWYGAQTWVQYLVANGTPCVIVDLDGNKMATPSQLEL